ncbi:hypothetical protein KBC54_03290 [Patescibacteria group bacterium]|nr:hypothetical protein [Patescibacteria group bacterium]
MKRVSLVVSFVVGLLFLVLGSVQLFGWELGWLPPFWAVAIAVLALCGVTAVLALRHGVREAEDRHMVQGLIREAKRAYQLRDKSAFAANVAGIVAFWSRERGFSEQMLQEMSPVLVDTLARWGTARGNACLGDRNGEITRKVQDRASLVRDWDGGNIFRDSMVIDQAASAK